METTLCPYCSRPVSEQRANGYCSDAHKLYSQKTERIRQLENMNRKLLRDTERKDATIAQLRTTRI